MRFCFCNHHTIFFMSFVIYCLSIILGLVFRRSQYVTVFILLTMFILAAFKVDDADMGNYLLGYYTASDEGRYVGFTLFERMISNLHFDFKEYLCIFYALTFCILFIGIRKLTINVNFVLASYLISFYALDVVQMKSALADAIVLFSIAYYFRNGTSYNTGRTIITIGILLLGVFIHFSVAFYLFAFFVYLTLKRKKYCLICILFIALILSIIFAENGLSNVLSLGSTLGMLGNDNEYLSGWVSQRGGLGFLVPLVEVFFVVMPYCLFKNIGNEENDTHAKLKIFMYTIVLTLPLLYLNATYTRLFRIYLILSSVIVSAYGIRLKYKLHELYILLMFFISLIYEFFTDTYPYWDSTLGALLNANRILSF